MLASNPLQCPTSPRLSLERLVVQPPTEPHSSFSSFRTPLVFTKMPSSSILSATSRLFVTNLFPKQHLFDSPRQYNRSQFQCSKGFLRFSVSCEGGRSGSSSSRLVGIGSSKEAANGFDLNSAEGDEQLRIEVGNPNSPAVFTAPKFTLGDQAFFLLAFIACTTSIAFTSLVIAAIPTLYAMGRAATSLSKLADTAREELPSTMAAIRLSGMEISDLTLELSDLSQEIADGVSKSTQAVQAAEAGIRKIGVLAREQTVSMIQERASLPIISLQPVVAGAARKTSHAMGQAKKTLMHMISRGDLRPENEENEDHRAEL